MQRTVRTRASNQTSIPRWAASATCLVGLLIGAVPARAEPLPVTTTLLPENPPAWVVRDDTMRAAADIALSPDGSVVYVASTSRVAGSATGSPTVSAYDASTGERRWRFSSRSTGGASSLALSPDGVRIYLLGSIQHGTYAFGPTLRPDYDIATWALKARNGDNLWYSRYEGPARLMDLGSDVVATDDLVVATGGTYRKRGADTDLWLRAYGARNGNVRWTRTYSSTKNTTDYDGCDQRWDRGNALAFANGGRTVVATGSNSAKSCNGLILTLAIASATGSVRWISRATHPENEDGGQGGGDLAVDRGRIYVAGYSYRDEFRTERWPVAASHRLRDGRKAWFRPYSPTEGTTGTASAVVVHPASGAPIFAGPVDVTPEDNPADGGDPVGPFQLWSLQPTSGALRWDSEDVGTGSAVATAMDPSGDIVYGAGSIEQIGVEPTLDAVAIAYDATDGSVLWRGALAEDGGSEATVADASAEHVFIGGGAGENSLLVVAFAAP